MKTEHIQKQLDFFVRDKAHHAYRKPAGDAHALAAELAAQGLDDMQRSVARLRYVLAQETPVVSRMSASRCCAPCAPFRRSTQKKRTGSCTRRTRSMKTAAYSICAPITGC